MGYCSVRNCKNKSIKGGAIRYFSFPKEETVANAWLQYCKPKTTKKTGRVCSVHFLPSDYHKPLRHILMNISPRKFRSLKPDAIPSLHIDASAQPSSCSKPIIDTSSDNDTKYILYDILTTDCKEPTNNSETSCCVQTQTTQIETCCMEIQTETCSDTVTIPASEYKELMTIKKKHQVMNNNLQQIFTPGQIRCLTTSDRRRIQWSAEDIAAAKTLRSISPKSYWYMRKVIGIPLPGFSTLYKRKINGKVVQFAVDETSLQCDKKKSLKKGKVVKVAVDETSLQCEPVFTELHLLDHDYLTKEQDQSHINTETALAQDDTAVECNVEYKSGMKLFVCKVCHKGFTRNYNLKVHMRAHGEDLIIKRNKPQPEPALSPTTSTNAEEEVSQGVDAQLQPEGAHAGPREGPDHQEEQTSAGAGAAPHHPYQCVMTEIVVYDKELYY